MSAVNHVPRKLERGTVVIFRRTDKPWQRWKKAVLDYYDSETRCYLVVGELDDEVLSAKQYTVIRSVALDDDKAQLNRRAKMRANYRARALDSYINKKQI